MIFNIKFLKSILFFIIIFFSLNTIAYCEQTSEGEIIFLKKCSLCHFADKSVNKIGPTLYHIINRKAASINNYNYSIALKNAAQNGLVWTKENIEKFIHNPHKMIRGTKMAILFMNNQKEINDLLDYLQSVK